MEKHAESAWIFAKGFVFTGLNVMVFDKNVILYFLNTSILTQKVNTEGFKIELSNCLP